MVIKVIRAIIRVIRGVLEPLPVGKAILAGKREAESELHIKHARIMKSLLICAY